MSAPTETVPAPAVEETAVETPAPEVATEAKAEVSSLFSSIKKLLFPAHPKEQVPAAETAAVEPAPASEAAPVEATTEAAAPVEANVCALITPLSQPHVLNPVFEGRNRRGKACRAHRRAQREEEPDFPRQTPLPVHEGEEG